MRPHCGGGALAQEQPRPGLTLLSLSEETEANGQKGLEAPTVDLILETESWVRQPREIMA